METITVTLHDDVRVPDIAAPVAAADAAMGIGLPADVTITGTDGGDRLEGTGAAEHILGLGGDDRVHGGDGHDRVKGGAGNDVVHGGAGDDGPWANLGSDSFVIAPGGGRDRIHDFDHAGDVVDLTAFGLTDIDALPGSIVQINAVDSALSLPGGGRLVFGNTLPGDFQPDDVLLA